MNDKDSLELRPLLIRLLTRGCWILLLVTGGLILGSMKFRSYLQDRMARQVTQAVRNDLLVGNSAAAVKILQLNVDDHFSRITYLDRNTPVFELTADADAKIPLWNTATQVTLCLDERKTHCPGTLVFEYSLLAFVPMILLGAGTTLGIFFFIFWIFRQHVSAYYRVQLQHHQEAALGRLSSRICHDLKIPSMIFQRAAYTSSATEFFEMQPLLQSHLHRLHRMIEKLKRADLEGLVHIESHTITKSGMEDFLSTLMTGTQKLQVMMPATLHVRLDLEKFERTLGNLVLNACQAGAQSLSVRIEPLSHDLRVTVENDGPPFEAAQVRGFLSRDRDPASKGLGLEIVKDTVLAHGGQHDLTSSPKATRFTLFFPHAVLQRLDESPPPAPLNQEAVSVPQGPMIYVDSQLIDVVHQHISADERGSFDFTDDPTILAQASLVISRQDQSIDYGLEHDIPVFVAGSSADDTAWLQALKSRLRLLNRARSPLMS